MKRGLVLLDPGEVRPDEFTARVSRLQRRLAADGVAAALIYGDVYRSGDISYLTNLCIYWNEGTVFVPASGEPALLSKLSSRVHPWMKSISTLKDTRAGNNIADLLVKTLGDGRPGVFGLVEMEWWPAPLVDEIRAKLSGWEVRDLGPIVRRERQRPSAAELALLRESAAVSARAVRSGSENALSNPQRAGRAELTARLAGVEDVYVFCDQCSSGADTLEVFSEYRGYWTTAARVVAKGSLTWARAFGRAYQAAESTLASGVSVDQLRGAVDRAMAGESLRWRVDLIDHTDLETRGDYRRLADAQAPVSAGAVAGLRLELTLEEGGRALAADTFQITERGAERLTRDLPAVVAK
jgi:hypothetical protein